MGSAVRSDLTVVFWYLLHYFGFPSLPPSNRAAHVLFICLRAYGYSAAAPVRASPGNLKAAMNLDTRFRTVYAMDVPTPGNSSQLRRWLCTLQPSLRVLGSNEPRLGRVAQ